MDDSLSQTVDRQVFPDWTLISEDEVESQVSRYANEPAEPSPEDRLLGLEDLRQHMPRLSFDGLKAVRKAQIAKLLPDGISVDEAIDVFLLASKVGNDFAQKLMDRRKADPPLHVAQEDANERTACSETNGQVSRV